MATGVNEILTSAKYYIHPCQILHPERNYIIALTKQPQQQEDYLALNSYLFFALQSGQA